MAEPINHWSILNEYSKSVITVIGALLALGGAFLSQSESFSPDLLSAILLSSAAFFLFLSIAGALLVNAFMYRILKAKDEISANPDNTQVRDELVQHEVRLKNSANLSYRSLGAASFLLVALLAISFFRKKDQANQNVLDIAIQAVIKYYKVPPESVRVSSTVFNAPTNNYKIILRKDGLDSVGFIVSINAQSKQFFSMDEISLKRDSVQRR